MTSIYTDGIRDVDTNLTPPGIVQPRSTALSTIDAPDINDMNLVSDVVITRNEDVEMTAGKEQLKKRSKPKSGK